MGGGFSGHAIEEPKTPGAHRVWQLLSIFDQAKGGWDLFVNKLSEGYAAAWDQQSGVLDDIGQKIKAENDRAMFILSVITAGVGGGLLGGIATGVFKKMSEVPKSFITNAASDAGSQFGGSAVSYFQSNNSSPFKSPGTNPNQYYPAMAGNVSLFFESLREQIGDVIDDIESGKNPQGDGEGWYQFYKGMAGVGSFPSVKDVNNRDFQGESSLCLWIAWGGQRDIPYWNDAWGTAQSGQPAGNMQRMVDYMRYVNDIKHWDPIVDEINNIDPHLTMHVQSSIDGDKHMDVRKLKDLGTYSGVKSAQALSRFFRVPRQSITQDSAKQLLSAMNELPTASAN